MKLFPLPSLTETLIWLLGFVALTSLTIKDFIPLITDYQHNNVAIQVELAVIGTDFTPPQIFLGIPLYYVENKGSGDLMVLAKHLHNGSDTDCHVCQKLANETWNVWSDMDPTYYRKYGPDAIYDVLAAGFVSRYFASIEANREDILDEKFSSWNQPVFTSLLNFFKWLTSSDFFLSPGRTSAFAEALKLLNVFENTKVFDKVFSNLLSRLCHDFEFSSLEYTNEFEADTQQGMPDEIHTCQDLLSMNAGNIAVGSSGLWLPMPQEKVPKVRKYRFTFRRGTSDFVWFRNANTTASSIIIDPDTSGMYMTAIDSIYSPLIFQKSIDNQSRLHIIQAKYGVQMRARETRAGHACYNGSSAAVCYTRCTKYYIIKKCGCIPFSYLPEKNYAATVNLPYCAFYAYSACNISKIPEDEHNACVKKCKDACEYISYNWQFLEKSEEPADPNTTGFSLEMSPMHNSYADFSWTTKNSPEQFLAQLSGIVNLYLGFSGLSLCALVITLIKAMKRMKKNKDENGTFEIPMADVPSEKNNRGWRRGSERKAYVDKEWLRSLERKIAADVKAGLKDELKKEIVSEIKALVEKGGM